MEGVCTGSRPGYRSLQTVAMSFARELRQNIRSDHIGELGGIPFPIKPEARCTATRLLAVSRRRVSSDACAAAMVLSRTFALDSKMRQKQMGSATA